MGHSGGKQRARTNTDAAPQRRKTEAFIDYFDEIDVVGAGPNGMIVSLFLRLSSPKSKILVYDKPQTKSRTNFVTLGRRFFELADDGQGILVRIYDRIVSKAKKFEKSFAQIPQNVRSAYGNVLQLRICDLEEILREMMDEAGMQAIIKQEIKQGFDLPQQSTENALIVVADGSRGTFGRKMMSTLVEMDEAKEIPRKVEPTAYAVTTSFEFRKGFSPATPGTIFRRNKRCFSIYNPQHWNNFGIYLTKNEFDLLGRIEQEAGWTELPKYFQVMIEQLMNNCGPKQYTFEQVDKESIQLRKVEINLGQAATVAAFHEEDRQVSSGKKQKQSYITIGDVAFNHNFLTAKGVNVGATQGVFMLRMITEQKPLGSRNFDEVMRKNLAEINDYLDSIVGVFREAAKKDFRLFHELSTKCAAYWDASIDHEEYQECMNVDPFRSRSTSRRLLQYETVNSKKTCTWQDHLNDYIWRIDGCGILIFVLITFGMLIYKYLERETPVKKLRKSSMELLMEEFAEKTHHEHQV